MNHKILLGWVWSFLSPLRARLRGTALVVATACRSSHRAHETAPADRDRAPRRLPRALRAAYGALKQVASWPSRIIQRCTALVDAAYPPSGKEADTHTRLAAKDIHPSSSPREPAGGVQEQRKQKRWLDERPTSNGAVVWERVDPARPPAGYGLALTVSPMGSLDHGG